MIKVFPETKMGENLEKGLA
jgi:hypothetical protein